jgi:hypothetical protein
LTEIARIFQIPVIWFFVGLKSAERSKANATGDAHTAALSAGEENVAGQYLALFAEELSAIRDPSVRIMLIDMARNLARHFK